jgi:hypothetical protein
MRRLRLRSNEERSLREPRLAPYVPLDPLLSTAVTGSRFTRRVFVCGTVIHGGEPDA